MSLSAHIGDIGGAGAIDQVCFERLVVLICFGEGRDSVVIAFHPPFVFAARPPKREHVYLALLAIPHALTQITVRRCTLAIPHGLGLQVGTAMAGPHLDSDQLDEAC